MAESRGTLAGVASATGLGRTENAGRRNGRAQSDWQILAADALIVALGYGLLHQAAPPALTLMLAVAAALVAVGWFWHRGHYCRRRSASDRLRDIASVVAVLAAVEFFAGRLGLAGVLPVAALLFAWAAIAGGLLIGRSAMRRYLQWRGLWQRPTVILGGGARARQVADAVAGNDALGLQVTEILPFGDPQPGGAVGSAGRDSLAELLLRFREHVILMAPEPKQMAAIDKLAPSLTVLWPMVGIAVPLYNTLPAGARAQILLDNETILLWATNSLSQRRSRIAKRGVDILGSGFGLLLFSPLFLALWLCGTLTRQPVFYGHRRIGRFGRPFTCHKFRTMVPNAAEVLEELLARDPAARREWDATYKLKDDPRVTRMGAFLRRSSLDELPQLWNVLKGDMSLVGPRPIVKDELKYYGDHRQNYLNVKPGLTGVWQVSGRNDTSYDYRVSLDRWYVTHWCLWYDVVIMAKTIGVMVNRNGAY